MDVFFLQIIQKGQVRVPLLRIDRATFRISADKEVCPLIRHVFNVTPSPQWEGFKSSKI